MPITSAHFNSQYGALIKQHSRPYTAPIQHVPLPYLQASLYPKFKCLGIDYTPHLSGVYYRANYITYVPLRDATTCIISYQFSGCYMAKLCYRGEWYGLHIATSDTPRGDCQSVWKEFVHLNHRHISYLRIIKPSAERPYQTWSTLKQDAKVKNLVSKTTTAGFFDHEGNGYSMMYNLADYCVQKGLPEGVVFQQATPQNLMERMDREYFWPEQPVCSGYTIKHH